MELVKIIETYLQNLNSENTKQAYKVDLLELIEFLKNDNIEFFKLKIDKFIEYKKYLRERNMSPGTIARKISSIKSFLSWLVIIGQLDKNPIASLKTPKPIVQRPTTACTDDEVRLLISLPDTSTFYGNLHKIILFLLFNLGLRRSEIVKIKLKDIYEDRGYLVLRILGKGQKDRFIPLNENIQDALKFYKETYESFSKVTLQKEDYLLQTCIQQKNSQPIDPSSINRIIVRYSSLARIPKRITAHSARATAISHLLDTQHVPIRDVADLVGHSSINTTALYDKKRKNYENSAAYKIKY